MQTYFDANANANPNPNPNPNANANANPNPNTNTNTNTDSDSDSDTHSHSDRNPDPDANPNSYSDPSGRQFCDRRSGCNRRKEGNFLGRAMGESQFAQRGLGAFEFQGLCQCPQPESSGVWG